MASFDPYEGAQALVDRLVDGGFPVERLAIVGRDLEIGERVMGWRAALAGGAPGAAFGLAFGLWLTPSLGAVVLYWFVVGTARRGGPRALRLEPRTGSPGRQVSCQQPTPKLLSVAEAAVRLATEADRDHAVEQLIREAGDRRCLEAVSGLFVYRLHRRSDDFDATYGLKLVITALQRVPYDDASPIHVG